MPAAAPVLLGAALSGITISAAGAIGFSFAAFAGSLVLGAVSYALAPKPPKPNFNNALTNKGSTVAVRQSDLTRQFVYGHTRITRGYAHMQSTGLNGKLHMILILCEGPLRSINEVWLNDYVIPSDWIDENGNVTQGRYAGKLVIRKHLGTQTQGADSLAVANMTSWTTDHRLQGVAYLYLIMTKDQDVYPTGVPNVSAIVEGPLHFDPRTGGEEWSTNMALFSHDFLTNQDYGFGALADEVDLDNVSSQANICDEIVATPAIDMQMSAVNTTTNIMTLSGDLLKYQFGDRVEIVTSGTPPGGLSTSTAYYIIPYQVKTTPRILLATSLDNAMAKIAIDITSSGSGTIYIRKTGEPRYHGSGAIDSETPLSDTLTSLVMCMAGRAVNVGGFWTLQAGAWRTPTVNFGIGDLRSSMSFKNALSMSDSFNVVKGLFVSSLNAYQSSDYPSIKYESFINEDGGIEAERDLNLPFVNRPTAATRIAKIELFRGRQDIIFNADFSTAALQVQPGDVIGLTIDRLGWNEKEFEITTFGLDVSEQKIVIRLTLRETAQQIYDWTSGEAIDYDAAPNTNLPDPYSVQVPTGVAFNSRAIDTSGGDTVYILTLNWAQHPDSFVTQFGDFEVQFKLSEEADWRPSFFVDGLLTETDVITSSVNVFYDLRIRARNNLGVRSGWVTIENAVAGSSGGVTETRNYRFVNESVTISEDYGFVYDAPDSSSEDWGYVV